MSASNFLAQAADVYAATGHPLAEGLRSCMLESRGHAVAVQPGNVAALVDVYIALAAPGAHPLATTIAGLADNLHWRDAKAMQELAATRDRHAYVEIVGPDGAFISQRVRFGLYFQSADTVYPEHRHAAEELYFVISGTAEWSKGSEPFAERAPGTLIHHLPMQPHATTTGGAPLLAMWAWLGDISPDSYEVSGVPGL